MSSETRTESPLETVVYDNDVVIVISDSGRSGAAFIRGHKVPLDVEVKFGEKDDPANTIRHLVVKAGYTLPSWRASDQDARDRLAAGSDTWQQAQDASLPVEEQG